MLQNVRGVDTFYWEGRRPVLPGRIGWKIPARKRVSNFGDLLGPRIVNAIVSAESLPKRSSPPKAPLFTVGSVLQYAETGSTVWGSGINGKSAAGALEFDNLDVRGVRGPLTAKVLRDRGIAVPDVFGDPALLLAELDPRLRQWASDPIHDVTVVPNLNDFRSFSPSRNLLDPRRDADHCLERICRSRLVISSSLHGIVIAESVGVPVVFLRSARETEFKYNDYFGGTGRGEQVPVDLLETALAERPLLPPPVWNPEPLLAAFPRDLWATAE